MKRNEAVALDGAAYSAIRINGAIRFAIAPYTLLIAVKGIG
jgi:hypothetical protein